MKLYRKPIAFLDEDLVRVKLSHKNALVITLNISRVKIRRVLINMRISSDIIFISAFK